MSGFTFAEDIDPHYAQKSTADLRNFKREQLNS